MPRITNNKPSLPQHERTLPPVSGLCQPRLVAPRSLPTTVLSPAPPLFPRLWKEPRGIEIQARSLGREKKPGGAPPLVPNFDPRFWSAIFRRTDGEPRLAFEPVTIILSKKHALPIPPWTLDETPEPGDVIRNMAFLFRVTSIVGA